MPRKGLKYVQRTNCNVTFEGLEVLRFLDKIGDEVPRGLTARPKLVFTLLLLAFIGASSLLANSPPQAYAIIPCAQPPAGLVAWWPGDGNANDVVRGNDGVLQGSATYAAGMVDQAFSFDGSTGYVRVPDRALWNLGTDFTIDLWANFNVVTGTDPFIAHDEGGGSVNKWIFWYSSTTGLTFHVNSPTLGSGVNVAYPAWAPSTGTWYHFTVTSIEDPGFGSTFRLYINGIEVRETTISAPIPDAAAPLTIGRAESFYFNGLIDEVEIFDRMLDVSQIQGIYDAGSYGKCVPITWRSSTMTGTSGTVLTIDGTYTFTYANLPATFYWKPGTTHTVAASTPVSGGAGKQYVWSSWAGGYDGLSGASGTYTTPAGARTVRANYVTQYYLTVDTNPSSVDSPTGEGWYDAGDTAHVSTDQYADIALGSRYRFDSWTGATGTYTDATVVMDAAKTATANYVTQYQVEFNQNGVSGDFTGTIVKIDGTDYSSLPQLLWWDDSSVHTFAFQSPLVVTANVKRYVWSSTNGLSTLQSDPITVSGSGNVVGNYRTQYRHTITSSPATGAGFVKVGGVAQTTPYTTPWWNSGSSHTIEALSPVSGDGGAIQYVWLSWSDGGARSHSVSPTSPRTFTANYQTQYKITAKTNHDVPLAVSVVVDSNYASPKTTPFFLPAGSHTFAAPWTILVGGVSYNFLAWQDGTSAVVSRAPTFTYNLQSALTAVYGLPTYTLTVFAYDSTTRAPLAGATVRLDGVVVGLTDSYGRLVISGVEAGNHTVKITKAGYVAYTTTVNIRSNIVLRAFVTPS